MDREGADKIHESIRTDSRISGDLEDFLDIRVVEDKEHPSDGVYKIELAGGVVEGYFTHNNLFEQLARAMVGAEVTTIREGEIYLNGEDVYSELYDAIQAERNALSGRWLR